MGAVVDCIACGTANPEGASFCMSCGAAFAPHCPKCGTVPPSRRASACRAAPRSRRGASSARRRRPRSGAPSLCCSPTCPAYTSVAEQLDPESLKGLLDQAMQRLGEEVTRFGGRVDKYIGDAVMALFGAPRRARRRPERALRAAFACRTRCARSNERFGSQHGASFELRVGLNTGEVLAGDVGHAYTVSATR